MNLAISRVCILLIICIQGFSQKKYSIAGEVFDESKNAIYTGEVYLIRMKDQSIIKSDLIINGLFKLDSLPEDEYEIQIVSFRFQDLFQKIFLNDHKKVNFILLKDKINELNEVKITNKKPIFIQSDGNIKIDIANSIFKTSPSPLDLLSKLPGVQISGNKESISVIGKGNPLIYIDNQKVGMNDLNALSVEDIKTIEIIKNPSSKYEAEGRSVLLITRKLSKKEGFEMTLSEIASYKKRFNNYVGLNTSYRKNKTEIKTNFNYNTLNPWESIGSNLEVPEFEIRSSYLAESYTKRNQYILGLGIYQHLNEGDYLSFSVNGKIQNDLDENTSKSIIGQNYIETLNNNDEERYFLNSFLNYKKNLKKINSSIFTGIQYSSFDQNGTSLIQNNYMNSLFLPDQNRIQDFAVDVFSGRTDMEKTFKNGVKWESGALFLSALAHSDFELFEYESFRNESSRYTFKEKNIAGYSQLSGKLKKSNYALGLRIENTRIEGQYQNETVPSLDKNYTNYFPKFQFDIPIDSIKKINFNYAKSITRPNYSSTSQVSIYITPFVLFSRNINLNPTITDEISATYTLNNKSLKLNFHRSKNPVNYSYSLDESQSFINFTSINYEKETGVNLELTIPYEYKFWSSMHSLNGILNKIEDPKAFDNKTKPYLYYYSNHVFKLPKNTTFSVTGWGLTDRKEGVFDRNALFIMNLAFSKTFFKSLEASLNFNDVFRNMNFYESLTINNINSSSIFYTDTREIAISIRYKFGSFKNSNYKLKEVNETSGRVR
ncbi:MAG: outer membrane beta-barrel protein [Leadbetterella sp.]